MKSKESELMIHFLHRPGMYVGSVNRETIVAFMHGADFGKNEEPKWTSLLSNFLEHELKIARRALGWPHQVEVHSERNKFEWIEGFKDVMLLMIEKSDLISYSKELKELNNKYKNR